jgi:hypothetical protein
MALQGGGYTDYHGRVSGYERLTRELGVVADMYMNNLFNSTVHSVP